MTELTDLAARSDSTLDGALGFELLEASEDRVTGRFDVIDAVRQPMGIVHGGAYAAMAETMASATTYMHVHGDGNIAVGQSNQTSFLRPVTEGTVHGDGRRRHRGRTSWIWEIDFTDDEGRLCAISRVTMAVRPAPE
ncbi:MAG: PaaI family thioesterase [Thermoleophilaceae bacterium]